MALARLTLQGANFLLLDEPTNHLDLASQEILEEVLSQFPGTILLVSHDRYLVQALATHIWRVAGDELRAYKGNYEEYLRQRAAEAERQGSRLRLRMTAPEDDRERAREERRQRKAAERQAEQAAAMEQAIHALEAQLAAAERRSWKPPAWPAMWARVQQPGVARIKRPKPSCTGVMATSGRS